jgi:hypothetical protein
MNANIIAIRQAFDNNDMATLASAHPSQLKAALKSDHQREMLFTLFARSDFAPPRWLEIYEKQVAKHTATAAAPAKESIARQVLRSTKEAADYTPLLMQEVDRTEWAAEIAGRQSVITKSGREISAAGNVIWGSQFAMTKIAMALKAAVDLKGLSPTAATRAAHAIHDNIEKIITGYAAARRMNHRELVMAEVTIVTQHGCFDTPTESTDWEAVLQEEGLGWDEIAEFERDQEMERESRQNELMHNKDSVAQDEGRISTALHEFGQLMELDVSQLYYAEGSYAQVAFMDQAWPTDHPMWSDVLDRLADAWANAAEWAETPEAAEALEAKNAERGKTLEDMQYKHIKTRWVLNHVARRLWRDIEVLKMRRAEYAARIDQIVQDAYINERYQAPVGGNRRRDEGADNDRVINLYYREVSEADVGYRHQQMMAFDHTFDNGVSARKHLTVYEEEGEHQQMDAELRFWGAVIDTIDEIIPGLTQIHSQLCKMQSETALLWELFARDGMPSAPPVYWNRTGHYATQEEAVTALHIELKEQKANMRAKDGDALAQAMALLGADFGTNI